MDMFKEAQFFTFKVTWEGSFPFTEGFTVFGCVAELFVWKQNLILIFYLLSLMVYPKRVGIGLAECHPGLWMREKLNHDRKGDQCACLQFRFWDV